MRILETVIGLLIVVAAGLLSAGVASTVVPMPPAGLGVALAIAGAGATIVAHGMTGHAQRSSPIAAGRWRALFYALLVLTLVAALPLVVDLLNLTTVAGFPIGFYMAAQGLLIIFAIIAFRASHHLNTAVTQADALDRGGDA